jgi:TusA-related sulfurtransferase
MEASVSAHAAQQKPPTDTLDVRGVQAPGNVLAVLKRASELPNGAILEIRSDSNPWQLYDLLQQRGFSLEMQRENDGSCIGRVSRRDI